VTGTVDLRSDTLTQPTRAMREAMASAVVGDDGYGEDPTVNELEARFASMLAKESAVFVPSGVMANQIAVRILTRPGDLVVTGRHQHLVGFEMGAAARNASVQLAVVGDDDGRLDPATILEVLDAELDHQPRVAAACLENTHMFAGGVPTRSADLRAVAEVLDGRPLHLDGARLFNAAVATGESPAELAAGATTVMAALSKGLGAPVGSLLAGPRELIVEARVERKRLGGAMRQAGVLAAAGLVALTSMVDRLVEDHARARRLADVVATRFPESDYDPGSCRTNIVAFSHPEARRIVERLASLGVLAGTIAPTRARLVTHLGLDDADIERACDVISSFAWR
jgi:threonine aldolase